MGFSTYIYAYYIQFNISMYGFNSWQYSLTNKRHIRYNILFNTSCYAVSNLVSVFIRSFKWSCPLIVLLSAGSSGSRERHVVCNSSAVISQGRPASLWPGQNGNHFADNIRKCIFWNENQCISFLVHWNLFKGNIDNRSALVQVITSCQANTKTNVGRDMWPHIVSLGHNEFNYTFVDAILDCGQSCILSKRTAS